MFLGQSLGRRCLVAVCGAALLTTSGIFLAAGTASAFFVFANVSDVDLLSAFNGCIAKYNLEDGSGDPAFIYRALLGGARVITIAREPHTPPYGSATAPDNWADAQNGVGTVSEIDWDPLDEGHPIGPELAPQNECAALYHEMYHALEFSRGEYDGRQCATLDTPEAPRVPISEVKATFAENEYRRYIGLDVRTTWNAEQLPPYVEDCYP